MMAKTATNQHWAVQRFRETGVRAPLPRVAVDAEASAPLTLADLPVERFSSLVVR